MIIGAQFYTLRDFCKTPEALAETMKRVADIGYTTIQLSGVCAYDPQWMAEELKKDGLTCNLTHFDFNRIANDTDAVVAEHNVYGCKYIGVGSMPGGVAHFDEFVERAKPAGKRIAELGSMLMYHNHNMEYTKRDGKTYMELLSELFAPEELGFTLDTYWVKEGGYDPVEEVKRLKGRLPCVHFKDMKVMDDGSHRFSWVGGGCLDFEKIISAMEDAGTKYAFIEQDNCYGDDPMECLRLSYNYLHALGLN